MSQLDEHVPAVDHAQVSIATLSILSDIQPHSNDEANRRKIRAVAIRGLPYCCFATAVIVILGILLHPGTYSNSHPNIVAAGAVPTATASPSVPASPAVSFTSSFTSSESPSATDSATATPSYTITSSFTASASLSGTVSASITRSASITPTSSASPSVTSSSSVSSTASWSASHTVSSSHSTSSTASYSPSATASASGTEASLPQFTAQAFTLAGSSAAGYVDATGTDAKFSQPSYICINPAGDLFVTDKSYHSVRMVTTAGVVTTLAGSSGTSGSTDDTGTDARFNNPAGVAADSLNNVYVADDTTRIRKVTPAGVVTTIATGLTGILALGMSSADLIYGFSNAQLVTFTTAGVMTVVAGQAGSFGYVDGAATVAKFNGDTAQIAVGANSYVYLAEASLNVVRKVTNFGVVSTIAGTTTAGNTDAVGAAAAFTFVSGIGVNIPEDGVLYVASHDHRLRRLSIGGQVAWMIGSSSSVSGYVDDYNLDARFNNPGSMAVGSDGTLYVCDVDNSMIRMVLPNL